MNILSFAIQPSFTTRFTIALLHFFWQGSVGAILVTMSGVLLTRRSATIRYAFNVGVLFLMSLCLPVTFAVLNAPITRTNNSPAMQTIRASMVRESENNLVQSPVPRDETQLSAIWMSQDDADEIVRATKTPGPSSKDSKGSASLIGSALKTEVFHVVSQWVFGLYLCGVTWLLARLIGGIWGGHKLYRSAEIVHDLSLLMVVEKLARTIGLKFAPTVAWCHEVTIPVVIGIVRPIILLPTALVSGLTPDQLQALVLHELSHIRRLDPIVNLIQRMIEAVLFFHPAVWFVSRRISIERENAADDLVLAAGWDRPNYADALVRMAELTSAFSQSRLAQRALVIGASGNNPTGFKLRVLRILGDTHPSELQLSKIGLLSALSIIASGGLIAWSQTDTGGPTHTSENLVQTRGVDQNIVIENPTRIIKQKTDSNEEIPRGPSPSVESLVQIANNPPVEEKRSELTEASVITTLEGFGALLTRDDTLPDRPVKSISFEAHTLFGDQQIHWLKSLPKLTNLNLNWTLCTDAGMKDLGELTTLTSLTMAGNRQVTDECLKHIGQLKELKYLSLASCRRITGVGVKELAGLKNLTALHLSRTQVTDDCLDDLKGLDKLEHLSLAETKVTEAGIRELQEALPNTKGLAGAGNFRRKVRNSPKAEESSDEATATKQVEELGGKVTTDDTRPERPVAAIAFQSGSAFDDNDLPVLKSFKHLTKLSLKGTLVSDSGMKELSELKNLVELELQLCEQITDLGAHHLKDLKNLKSINVVGTEIGDAGIKDICDIENLTTILVGADLTHTQRITDISAKEIGRLSNLTSLTLWSKLVTDQGVKELGQLKNLTSLNLQTTQIAEAGAKELCRLENLSSLILTGPHITSAAAKELSRHPNLKSLILAGEQITDEGATELPQLKTLTKLVLASPKLTSTCAKSVGQIKTLTSLDLGAAIDDEGVKELLHLNELKTLILGSSKITDAGIKELGQLKNLKSISFRGSSQVTPDGIAELQKELPEARITGPQRRSRR